MQSAKNKTQDEEEEGEVTKSKRVYGRSPVDKIIEEYKEEARRRDTTPKATIYKYENEKSGQDRIFAGYFTGDEIPNRHNIGLLYGSGRFTIELDQPKGKADEAEECNLTFKIHSIYDALKAKADAENRRKEIDAGGNPALMVQPQANQSFQMAKDILTMILPLVKAANPPAAIPAPAARTESPADMFNSYQMMQKLLKTQLFDTAATYREFSRRYAGPETIETAETDEEETEQKEPSIVEKIITMIEPFFGLIAQKSESAKLAAMGLKAAPQFIGILNDPALCRLIVNHFDRTRGREKSDIALKNIGIDRQQLFKTPPTPAGTPQARPKPPPPTGQAPGPGSAAKPL
jgi:hypothetical protein